MLDKDFAQGANIISQTFGEAPFKGPRLNRVKAICRNKISSDGWIEVCNQIADSMRTPPLPIDFEKAITEWRKQFYYKHGRYYEAEGMMRESVQISDPIACFKCNDIGIVRLTHHKDDGFETLMWCNCGTRRDNFNGPEWDSALNGAFKKDPCPKEWFMPNIKEGDPDAKIYSKILERLEYWKQKKRKAEAHWASIGFGQEETK